MPEPRLAGDARCACSAKTGADVVTGPVLPRFEPSRRRAGSCRAASSRAPRAPTGTRIDTAYTNNVLVRARLLLEPRGELFDERLTLGVGEDTELFSRLAARRRAHRLGRRGAWCTRRVPRGARARTRWLLRRGFVVGTATTHVAAAPRRARCARVAHALAHGGWCVAQGRSRTALVRVGARRAARCAGSSSPASASAASPASRACGEARACGGPRSRPCAGSTSPSTRCWCRRAGSAPTRCATR